MTAFATLLQRIERGVARLDGRAGLDERDAESGAATIEFVLLAPIFFLMFCSSVESSVFMYRQLLLERAVDHATREVRLDGSAYSSPADLKARICEMMSDDAACIDAITIEMTEIDMDTYDLPDTAQPCLVRDDAGEFVYDRQTRDSDGWLSSDSSEPDYVTERHSMLVLMRACYAARPILPLSGLGADLVNTRDGETMSIVTTTAFRVEPQ